MTLRRLTPRQSRQLVAIYRKWGQVFHALNVLPGELLRDPSKEELDAHYASMTVELAETHARLIDAAARADYKAVADLAHSARYLADSIATRDNAEWSGFQCLTDEAKMLAARLEAQAVIDEARSQGE